MGSGEALAVGTAEGATAVALGVAVGAGWADVGVGEGYGVAHTLSLVGTGWDVADPAPPTELALALGTGVATAVGQDSLLGTGSGVAGFPVGDAEGALADAEALGAADALGDAFALA